MLFADNLDSHLVPQVLSAALPMAQFQPTFRMMKLAAWVMNPPWIYALT